MLDLSAFRVLHPEFAAVQDDTIEAKLAAAELRTDAEVFGDLTDEAHGWLTAHLLAASPAGREALLKGGKEAGATRYSAERDRLENICCSMWVE
jgi:hypothetical protein